MDPISLSGRVALVTGAGAGLGRAYALDLAAHGAAVVVNDLATAQADETVALVRAAGGRAAPSYGSVADRAGAQAIVAAALDAFGTLDVLVNNAGIMRNAWFEEQEPEAVAAVLDTHLGGAFWVSQAAWPVLRAKRYGRIVMIGSSAGMWSMQAVANYAAAKGGIYGLARALAFEGADHGIQVNTLLPGAATTISAATPVPEYARHVPQDLREALAPRRSAANVAPMVTFLASEQCALNGETFSAVAGRYARVLVAVTEGWFAEDHASVTADTIAEHLGEISDEAGYHLPASLYDEYRILAPRLGVPA